MIEGSNGEPFIINAQCWFCVLKNASAIYWMILTGITAHIFAAGEDMPLRGAFDVLLGGAGLEIQLGIERI
jgi:hypothetical protein